MNSNVKSWAKQSFILSFSFLQTLVDVRGKGETKYTRHETLLEIEVNI